LADAALELRDRKFGYLKGDRAHPNEAIGVAIDHFSDVIVDDSSDLEREICLPIVVVETRRWRQSLHVHAECVHVVQALIDVE
jgi:hypothetical protein